MVRYYVQGECPVEDLLWLVIEVPSHQHIAGISPLCQIKPLSLSLSLSLSRSLSVSLCVSLSLCVSCHMVVNVRVGAIVKQQLLWTRPCHCSMLPCSDSHVLLATPSCHIRTRITREQHAYQNNHRLGLVATMYTNLLVTAKKRKHLSKWGIQSILKAGASTQVWFLS